MGKRGLVLAVGALVVVAFVVGFLVGRAPKHSPSSRLSLASEHGHGSEAESPAPSTGAASDIVHATRTGKRYHRAGCSSLSRSDLPLTRAEAEQQGLTPCKVCNP